ncbi:MAG: carboxylating nicotinate-nucleotide diphosphorylase [Actinomycetota bacterium]|nr:carboxylating nicotinate-nucleotide diphosphorylase [Actinomycetota bacterium]
MGGIPQLNRAELEDLARRALAEDLGEAGDITTKRIVRIDQPARAQIVAKSAGILAGTPVAEVVFHVVDKSVAIDWRAKDSASLAEGDVVCDISGRARAILAAERVALNFLQHLSGVATMTAAFVDICTPLGVRILCTRKTLPGLRAVQRYAVTIGGGQLHRAGLYDAILIKTNHTKLSGGLAEAVKRTKANPNLEAEVEVRDLGELEAAIEAGADRVLLDNADLPTIKQAVAVTRGRVFLEVSGGVTIKTVEKIAKLGPDAISVGAITHSVPALDLALRIMGPPGGRP